MQIQFLGACRTVTGSSHLLTINGKKILLDCGMYQGHRDQARSFNEWIPDSLRDLDAIVLSHGHLDHCGKLPVLARAEFNVPIYCTDATADVARIVLADAGEIQQEDAQYMNRRQRKPGDAEFKPLYTLSDARRVTEQFKTVRYGQTLQIAGTTIQLFDAGHILGSAYISVEWQEDGEKKSLLFTGDIGRPHTPIINDPAPLPGRYDFVISESTYGGRTHAPINEIEPQLLEAIQTIIARQGRLIVPSFAVGRTQTILWYMMKFMREKKIPPINVYVDSPMGIEVTDITEKRREYFDPQTVSLIGKDELFANNRITFAKSAQQSRQVNADRGPCVIIASSPTCEFGRILHHLKQSLERPADMLLFVGFTPYNTLGRRLQDGQNRVRIYDRYYDVQCEVRTLHGLSAHADGTELADFLAPTCHDKTTAFIVHGETDQQMMFAQTLSSRGMGQCIIPALETELFAV